MEFAQKAHEELYARVSRCVTDAFGALVEVIPQAPAFRLRLGQTRILISVDATGPDKASVTLYTVVADRLEITHEIALFLLRRNYVTPFGSLCLTDDGAVGFHHILLGESLAGEALSALLRLFGSFAEQITNELTTGFG